MEDKIMKLITSEQSWEQVIYEIVAWEGLDPWDLNIGLLSDSFIKHIEKTKEIDFKIPAKYVIIAAILLRMKSDHLEFLELFHESEDEATEELEIIGEDEQAILRGETDEIGPLELPPRRLPERKLIVDDLIFALKKALKTEKRKVKRLRKAKNQIVIEDNKILERIGDLYKKIDGILDKIKQREIEFSKLVNKWERSEVIETFLPLIYLEQERRVSCRQEEVFKEIFVSKR
ncbi:MAG: segregation/condensation protein A [Candidatus Aenigmarchaeota archaeon]|nr:segregation/condensation protein A [Candidatus Aenigmarchaeota archaeon]